MSLSWKQRSRSDIPCAVSIFCCFCYFFFQISTSILFVGAGFFIYLFIFGARGFGILSSRLISLTGLVLVST
jgi:hypothetical protein